MPPPFRRVEGRSRRSVHLRGERDLQLGDSLNPPVYTTAFDWKRRNRLDLTSSRRRGGVTGEGGEEGRTFHLQERAIAPSARPRLDGHREAPPAAPRRIGTKNYSGRSLFSVRGESWAAGSGGSGIQPLQDPGPSDPRGTGARTYFSGASPFSAGFPRFRGKKLSSVTIKLQSEATLCQMHP